MRVGLTYDLRSEYLALGYSEEETAEFDRDETIEAIEAVDPAPRPRDRPHRQRARLIERLARGDRWDLVFNIAEGLRGIGREAQVPAIARRLRHPLHLLRPAGPGAHPAQGPDQARRPRRGHPHARLRPGGATADATPPSRPSPRPFRQAGGRGDRQGHHGQRRRSATATSRSTRLRGPARDQFRQPVLVETLPARPGVHRRHRGHRRPRRRSSARWRSCSCPRPRTTSTPTTTRKTARNSSTTASARRRRPADRGRRRDRAAGLAGARLPRRRPGRPALRPPRAAAVHRGQPARRASSRALGPAHHLFARRDLLRPADRAHHGIGRPPPPRAQRPPLSMRIAILHNAVSGADAPDEQDVLVQVEAVAAALERLGHQAWPLPCTLDLAALRARLAEERPDLAFNLVESLDGTGRLIHLVPALLDHLRIGFTGAPTEAVLATSHKLMAKERMRALGLPTPAWLGPFPPGLPPVSAPAADGSDPAARWIVKSLWEHASIGIDEASLQLCADAETARTALERRARELGGACFAERFVDGREFNLSLLAGPAGPDGAAAGRNPVRRLRRGRAPGRGLPGQVGRRVLRVSPHAAALRFPNRGCAPDRTAAGAGAGLLGGVSPGGVRARGFPRGRAGRSRGSSRSTPTRACPRTPASPPRSRTRASSSPARSSGSWPTR